VSARSKHYSTLGLSTSLGGRSFDRLSFFIEGGFEDASASLHSNIGSGGARECFHFGSAWRTLILLGF
jgi:hypothetical protein